MFSWLARRKDDRKVLSPTDLEAADIVFVGEQDGPAESQLKVQLARLFARHPGVAQAYLARATLDGQTSVVLAARADGVDQSELARQVGTVFARIFNTRAHLDVLFLDAERQTQVSRVCPAFYTRPA
jgi:hypothetical protein